MPVTARSGYSWVHCPTAYAVLWVRRGQDEPAADIVTCMNFEKVVFGFFVLLAATLNFGFFYGDILDPRVHNVFELYAAVVVNLVVIILKFGDRTQMGAVHLATSLVATLQLVGAAAIYIYASEVSTLGMDAHAISSVVSLCGGALVANIVSIVLLVIETSSFRHR